MGPGDEELGDDQSCDDAEPLGQCGDHDHAPGDAPCEQHDGCHDQPHHDSHDGWGWRLSHDAHCWAPVWGQHGAGLCREGGTRGVQHVGGHHGAEGGHEPS